MDLATIVLMLKSLVPTIKEYILGKQTLRQALQENMSATILIAIMIVMTTITYFVSSVSNGRLYENQQLQLRVEELEATRSGIETPLILEECMPQQDPSSVEYVPDVPFIPLERDSPDTSAKDTILDKVTRQQVLQKLRSIR